MFVASSWLSALTHGVAGGSTQTLLWVHAGGGPQTQPPLPIMLCCASGVCSYAKPVATTELHTLVGLLIRSPQGPTEEVFHNLHALLGHRRKKPYRPEPLPALRRADGSLCSDGDEILARWRQHFGALEAGP